MLVMEAERFGGPQVLTARQVPDPVAGPGQVVVRTSDADVPFVDYSEPGWAGQVRELTAADAYAALESRLAVAKTLLRP
jgi:NADPH:quinone reductase